MAVRAVETEEAGMVAVTEAVTAVGSGEAMGSYAHQRHFSSELMHNPPLQINTVKCVEGCHMGREGCDRTRAR